MNIVVLICICQCIGISYSAVPFFSNVTVPILVREDVTSETLLTSFSVIDPDNGTVTSCIHSEDSSLLDVRQNPIDSSLFELYKLAGTTVEYDATPEITCVITCTDDQSESNNENITIDVIPNQPPKIGIPTSPLSVSENAVTQTFLYSLNATDVENDVIFCDVNRSTPASNNFGVIWNPVQSDYFLYLLNYAHLDYVTVTMYTVTVECWDYYGTSELDINVFVLPNSAPAFTNLPVATVYSDTSSVWKGGVNTGLCQFNQDVLHILGQMELQQNRQREHIFELQTENRKLKEALANFAKKDGAEMNQVLDTASEHNSKKRGGFTFVPPTVPAKPAFAATLAVREHRNIGSFGAVIFEKVLTNVGNAYSNTTGFFTAPEQGTYFFMASIIACGDGYFEANIMKNWAQVAALHVDDKDGREMASSATTLVLDKGDRVSIMHNDNQGNCITGLQSTFTGFQI